MKASLPSIVLVSVVLLAASILPGSAASAGPDGPSPDLAPAMYRFGLEFQISTPASPLDANRLKPALAHNWRHNQYLVVWHNLWPGNRDIYAQRVSENGQRVGPWFAVSAGAGDRVQPAVAYSATDDEYLVVWMKEVSPDVYEIWGRIVAWNGGYQHPEFKIISWPNRTFYSPRVAWNSYRNEYLVVWNAFDTTTSFPPGVPNDIAGARITNENGGKVLATNILTVADGPHQVDITYNVAMNEYFIAFVVVHLEAVSGNDIYGLRVDGNTGKTVNPPGLIVIYEDAAAGQKRHQNQPAVATNEQDKYMVVWQHQYGTGDHDIYGREFNANGTPAGAAFTISSWTEDDTAPDVTANGANREWVAVWQRALPAGSGYSIHGFRWGSAGSSATTYVFDVANWLFHEYTSPAVAADIPGYLVVYEGLVPPGAYADSENLTTYQHIYGRRWTPEAAYLPLAIKTYKK